eukprot:Nk52_evm22s1178 gene=Nk52_evmTU22s1178
MNAIPEIAEIIKETRSHFEMDSDMKTVSNIIKAFKETEEMGQAQVNRLMEETKVKESLTEELRQVAENSVDDEEHGQRMAALESTKYSVAKNTNNLEQTIEASELTQKKLSAKIAILDKIKAELNDSEKLIPLLAVETNLSEVSIGEHKAHKRFMERLNAIRASLSSFDDSQFEMDIVDSLKERMCPHKLASLASVYKRTKHVQDLYWNVTQMTWHPDYNGSKIKMNVRNSKEIRELDCDKNSKFFLTNYIWDQVLC